MTPQQTKKQALYFNHSKELHCSRCERYLSPRAIQKGVCQCGLPVGDTQRIAWVVCCEVCEDFIRLWERYCSGMPYCTPSDRWRCEYVGIQGMALPMVSNSTQYWNRWAGMVIQEDQKLR